MSYVKRTWVTGETITAEKLNHMEDGIAAINGLVVRITCTDIEGTYTYESDTSLADVLTAIEGGNIVTYLLTLSQTGWVDVYTSTAISFKENDPDMVVVELYGFNNSLYHTADGVYDEHPNPGN